MAVYFISINDFGPDEELCYAFVEADSAETAAEKIFAEFKECERNEDFNATTPDDLVPFLKIVEKGTVIGSF